MALCEAASVPIECKASNPDTEFHGVRDGVARSRSFWRFAQNYWDHAVVFCAKRNMPTPCNSVPSLRDTPCRACLPCLLTCPATLARRAKSNLDHRCNCDCAGVLNHLALPNLPISVCPIIDAPDFRVYIYVWTSASTRWRGSLHHNRSAPRSARGFGLGATWQCSAHYLDEVCTCQRRSAAVRQSGLIRTTRPR